MTDVDAILLSSALPFVDGVTDLNAATLNQLEVAARKGQLNGYLGIDGAGNISPPGHIFLGVDKQIAANLYSGGSSFAFSTAVNSEPQNRYTLRADGSQLYGPGGSVAPDTNLYRAGPGALRTDTDFQVGGKFVGKGAVPAGGASGQVLTKNSPADYDALWSAPPAGGLTLIADSGELATAQASIVFSAIPGTYRALRLLLVARGDAATTVIVVWVRFNGDAAANYDYQGGYFAAATANAYSAAAVTQTVFGTTAWPGASSAANAFSVGELLLPSYASTSFHKTFTYQLGGVSNQPIAESGMGRWRSTAAITSLTLLPNGGNFAAKTRAVLYGI